MDKTYIKQFLNTHYWFNYQSFYKHIAENPEILKALEVGVWKGHSISFLTKEFLRNGKEDFEIIAVDIWGDWGAIPNQSFPELPYIYDIYNLNLELQDVRKYIRDIKEQSDLAANLFEDGYLDFIFIDANHEYEYVRKDILAWLPKVRRGGILAGHDYASEPNVITKDMVENVRGAVDDLFTEGLLPKPIIEGCVWKVTL